MDDAVKTALYRDSNRPVLERVRDLMSRMTVEEKIAQLGAAWSTSLVDDGRLSEDKATEFLARGIGHVTRVGGSTGLAPRESALLANACQRYLIENTRLGIPAIVHEESCAGYAAFGGTCFPQAIGLASTWEPQLIEAMGNEIRRQIRAVGGHHTLAPVLDVVRDPRWGRCEETFGEDPYLISRIGVAYVKGMQGEDWKARVVATGKHFVGHGSSEGGLNWAPAHIPPRELLEIYVTPFAAAIREAKLGSIMNGYHELDGIPCGANPYLFEELLRGQVGFDGVVVSDYFTLPMLTRYHKLAAEDDKAEGAALALEAGIDVELPATDCYGEPLREALEAGRVDISLIDRSVERVLRMKFELGLFEQAFVDADAAPSVFETAEQRQLARRLAQKAIVLLKNDGDLLPLSRSIKKLAVIGPNANNARGQLGDYHYPAHGELIVLGRTPREQASPEQLERLSALEQSVKIVTVLEGIRNAAPETEVLYAQGCDVLGDSKEGFAEAVEAARQTEVAIVVVGDRSGVIRGSTSGETIDRATLGLAGVQQELVEAVVATGTPVVVVLANGRPLALPWISENVPAVLEAWYSGEEGGNAIADVLFGEVSPGGKLPISLPHGVGQVPRYYGHKPSGGRTFWHVDYMDMPVSPLYPFGHGLSYTTFEYGELTLGADEVPPDGVLNVSVEVRNSGERSGDEVVQLYLRDPVATVTRPVKQLAGFKRVTLLPGASCVVSFSIDVGQLAFYDRKMDYIVEPGEVQVMVGSSSEDIRQFKSCRIVGERCIVDPNQVAPTRVEVT
jgi:beta-glucosidase